MPSSIYDPEHWRQRAGEARSIAEQIEDPEARRIMIEIADSYERLAVRALARLDAARKSD